MKIAFAHCRLLPWGAQKVLEQLINNISYKQAQIFTLISEEKKLTINNKTIKITTVIPRPINNLILRISNKNIRWLRTLFDYRNLIIFAPFRAWIMSKQIKKYNPDKVFISSFARSKNIDTANTPTTLYLHSPMQYIWTHYEEYCQKLTSRRWRIFRNITPILRKRDKKPRTYNKVISNSYYTKEQAKKIYNIDSNVRYPEIHETIITKASSPEYQNYFIYTWRLVSFVKEVDKIIQACNQTQTPIIIMGDWPDKEKLQSIAGNSIIFMSWIQDIHQRIQLIQWSKWLINITKESFGISTMEALLLGVPVLWYDDGATPELMDNNSGILIPDKNITTICSALQKRDSQNFNRKKIQIHAREMYNKTKENI